MIIWKKKLIECCKCHKKYSFDDNLFYHLKEYILVCPNCNLMHKVDIQLLGEEYEGLKKIDRLNLTAITIGDAISDRDSYSDGNVYTFVSRANPANADGVITKVGIWAKAQMGLVAIATFSASGNYLTARDSEYIGTITIGEHSESNGNPITVSLNVEAGDYIGVWWVGGQLENGSSGGAGYWKIDGNQTACSNKLFTLSATRAISLGGTGATAPAGWPHKWNGITIGKLNGAVISKWNGVA